MTTNKLKLLYLVRYLEQYTDEQHPKTIQDMIDYLSLHEISAERKGIYRDLNLLSEFGMDIQTVKSGHYGYYLGERDFQLAELKMLIDVVQASPFLTKGKSMDLIGKLEKLTSKPLAAQLGRQVFVMNRIHTNNERLYYTVDGINTAINENKRISFRYFDWTVDGKKAYRRDGALYTADPVALCVDRNYYLIAFDAQNSDYRHYRLDRMENLSVCEERRSVLPVQFDLGSYVKSHFDMYKGETATLILRFKDKLLNAVIDRFGTDNYMRKDSGGFFILNAPVDVGPTFFGWLFQFGNDAEIVAPPEIRCSFSDYCRDVLKRYE